MVGGDGEGEAVLIPVTPNLWLDPKAITSVERVVTDRRGAKVDYVEIHAGTQFWTLSDVKLSDLVAKVNQEER